MRKAPEHCEHLTDQGLAIVSFGALHLQIIYLASCNIQLVRYTLEVQRTILSIIFYQTWQAWHIPELRNSLNLRDICSSSEQPHMY